jgi:hypothetical protein
MATYVNDLRLTELATGEGSGTWGTTTNTNLELIGEALGYATQQAFGSDADTTTTVADGVSDPARAMYYKVTSAVSLTATRTLTIAPNTLSRVMFIENATTGSQSIAISQGSGANVTIAAGKTAVVYLDGAGATAAVVDAMAGVDPGVTDTLAEVLVAGNTSGGTNIELTTTDKVQFRDTAIYLNSSADGQLDIVADTEVQIATTTLDLNGILDVSGNTTLGADVTFTGASYNVVWDSSADSLTFADNAKAIFGAGSDLQIYHNATNNIIDSSAATLAIQAPQFVVQDDTGTKNIIWVTQPAVSVFDVRLSYDGSTKLTTTATGIDVTGTVTADGLTVDDVVSIDTSTGNAFSSTGNLKIDIDSDNNQTDRTFQITSDGSSKTLFEAKEGGDISFYDDTGFSQSFFWDASAESLGIGTSSPTSLGGGAKLTVNQAADGNIVFARGGSTRQVQLGTTSTTGYINADNTSGGLTFNVNASERMRIDTSGNVGIGTSSVNGKLDIKTSSAGFEFYPENSTDTNLIINFDRATSTYQNLQVRAATHQFLISDSEKMRIDASGNVGIGTSSPASELHVKSSGTLSDTLTIENSTGNGSWRVREGSSSNALLQGYNASNSETIRLDPTSDTFFNGSNVGIGTSAPDSILHLSDTGESRITFEGPAWGNYIGVTAYDNVVIAADENQGSVNSSIRFRVDASERMRIDAGGNLLVGTTDSNSNWRQWMGIFSRWRRIQSQNGTASVSIFVFIMLQTLLLQKLVTSQSGSSTAYNTSSDQRLKDNIVDAPSASDDIDAIQVRSFDWKADGSHQKYGMVAQELQTVAPEAVSGQLTQKK